MPSPFERLTNKLTESRRQAAVDWVENSLGEAERTVRNKWKQLEALGNARKQLRDNYTSTEAEFSEWQEQRKEIEQAFRDEELLSRDLGGGGVYLAGPGHAADINLQWDVVQTFRAGHERPDDAVHERSEGNIRRGTTAHP